MICKHNGKLITTRLYPELLKIATSLIIDKIYVSLPRQQSISIDPDECSTVHKAIEVWGNHFTPQIAPIKVNQFFSQFLQKNVQLRWLGKTINRRIKHLEQISVSFAVGFFYLLINTASFRYLEQQCPEKLDIRQFRENIVINGALPIAEDSWKTIKIGKIIFDIVKPCSRCTLTTYNPFSAKQLANHEPLKTLKNFRPDSNGNINFDMNMIARNRGTISINDKIEIIG